MKFLLSIIFITSFVVCEKEFSSAEASEIDSMKDNPLNIDHRRATRTEISSTVSEKDIGDDEYPPAMQKSFAYDPQEEESKRKEAEQKRMRDSIRRQKKSSTVHTGESSYIDSRSTSSGVTIAFSIKKASSNTEDEEN